MCFFVHSEPVAVQDENKPMDIDASDNKKSSIKKEDDDDEIETPITSKYLKQVLLCFTCFFSRTPAFYILSRQSVLDFTEI